MFHAKTQRKQSPQRKSFASPRSFASLRETSRTICSSDHQQGSRNEYPTAPFHAIVSPLLLLLKHNAWFRLPSLQNFLRVRTVVSIRHTFHLLPCTKHQTRLLHVHQPGASAGEFYSRLEVTNAL